MLWKHKSIEEDNTWIFNYFGVPTDFKVIIAYDDGKIDVSELFHKDAFDYEITIDAINMETKVNSINDISKNIILPLLITIFVELLISLIFIKKNVYNFIIIIIINAITNSIFQFILRITTYSYGSIFMQIPYLGIFIFLEIIITLIEMFIYNKTIKNTEKESIIKYTLLANFITMILTK